jgi:hypothetical protein
MAYNNYFPQFYNPTPMPYMAPQPQMAAQGPQVPQNAPQNQNSNLTWVQGEAAAKAYPVANGQSVLLMDSEDSVMYIKSTDASGMPLPLRIFDYKERNISGTNRGQSGDKSGTTDFVSRSEFDQFKHDITESINGIRNGSDIGEG